MSAAEVTGLGARGLGLTLLGALGGLALAVGASLIGPAVALLPLLAVAGVIMLVRPAFALATLMAAAVLLESDEYGFLPARARAYESIPGILLTPVDLLVLVVISAVLLDLARRRRLPRLPGPATWPLALLVAAGVGGAITGLFAAGDPRDLLNVTRSLGYLVIAPPLIMSVLEDRPAGLHVAAVGAAVLAAIKAVEGLVAWGTGAGRTFGESVITFYEAAPNLLLMVFLLTLLAAALTKVRLPVWAWGAGVLALTAFTLSYRRSFWVGAIIGALTLLLVASGVRRRLLVLGLVGVLGLGFVLVLQERGVVSPGSESPVVARVRSLAPSRIRADREDRYRLAEQRNVREALLEHPWTGLGLGVGWEARYPLPLDFEGSRQYVHGTFLWHWLKFGVLGAIAYAWLMVTSIVLAYGAWRRLEDRFLRAVSLGLGAGLVSLALVETTATFTGKDDRVSLLVGFALGWLALASARARDRRDHRPEGPGAALGRSLAADPAERHSSAGGLATDLLPGFDRPAASQAPSAAGAPPSYVTTMRRPPPAPGAASSVQRPAASRRRPLVGVAISALVICSGWWGGRRQATGKFGHAAHRRKRLSLRQKWSDTR